MLDMNIIGEINIMDDIVATLSLKGTTLFLNLFDGEKEVYSTSILSGVSSLEEFGVDNLGSGKTDDGVYCISLAVLQDGDDGDIGEHLEIALYYDGTEVEVYNLGYWTSSETNTYFVYSEHTKDFSNYKYA